MLSAIQECQPFLRIDFKIIGIISSLFRLCRDGFVSFQSLTETTIDATGVNLDETNNLIGCLKCAWVKYERACVRVFVCM